jgi:hypothetical protein
MFLFCLSLIFAANNSAQQTENSFELYEKGEYQKTIDALKNSDEVKDLYYLGLAYEKTGEKGKAKDAFKKSFAASYIIFHKKLVEWQKIPPGDAKKKFSDLLHEYELNNRTGLVAAEKAYTLDSGIFQYNEWHAKAKVLSDLVDLAKTDGEIYSAFDKPISGIEITEMPRAPAPKDSTGVLLERRNQFPNIPIHVTFLVIFGADEKIKLVMPLDDLFDAYTVQGLKAASGIKFKPATKNTKPVSYQSRAIYSFSRD